MAQDERWNIRYNEVKSSKNVRHYDQRESVAFLLGAGFSIPMGYPKGADVNNDMLHFDEVPVAFSPAGVLASNTDGTKPNFDYTNNYDRVFCLCKELIAAYSYKVKEFDYERFMDVLRSKTLHIEYASVFEKHKTETGDPYYLFGNLPDIYSQMVAYLLKDADKKSWYEGKPTHIGPYSSEPRALYNDIGFVSRK